MSVVDDHGKSRPDDDEAAFCDYVHARETALLRIAVMLTGNRADAEDLLQAALAKTYVAWGKIHDRAAMDSYVRRAMVNTQISWIMREKATWPKWCGVRLSGCPNGCARPSCSAISKT
jgi:DNA-directed RNA polymerase specialized sigma24 family protein